MGAHLSDDSATDGSLGDVVEGVVISKSSGVFCGRLPVDLLISEWFPSCDLEVEYGRRRRNRSRKSDTLNLWAIR